METNNTDHDNRISTPPTIFTDPEIVWERVDLKTLIAFLSLATPPISQAKVAQSIGISPVTLSRILNGNDPSIKKEWIPALTDLLSTLNIAPIGHTYLAVDIIQSQKRRQDLINAIYEVMPKYFSKYDIGSYESDPDFWGSSLNIVRFVNSDRSRQWLVKLGSETEPESWYRDSILPLAPYYSFDKIKSITSNDRVSLCYSDKEIFSNCIFFVSHVSNSPEIYKGFQFPYYLSLILLDVKQKKVIEEYVVGDPNSPSYFSALL